MKNDVKISTDRYEILSSGCIIIPSLESLMFEFDELRFKISFLAADSSAPKFVSNVDRDDKGDFLSIIMYGFENSFLLSSNKEIHEMKKMPEKASFILWFFLNSFMNR